MATIKQGSLLKKLLTSEYFIATYISLAIWIVLFIASGLLFSGFHFIDDHEIVVMNSDLQTMSLPDVLHKWLLVDYNIPRFRPVYYIHRVLQTKLFGLNWIAWFAYACLQSSITTVCLFIFARSLQFSKLESALLAGLIVFGQQSVAWFRLGPAETTAMPFLAVALACAAIDFRDKRSNSLRNFLLCLSTLFASLCKESFILFIPAICLIRVWSICRNNLNISFKQILYHRDIFPCYFLLAIFGLEVLYIKFVIGTGGTGYAGVDASNFNFTKIVSTFSVLAQQGNLLFALIFLSLFCLLGGLRKVINRTTKLEIDRSLLVGLVFILIIFPQVLLYTKSGFSGHYLLPALMGCALLNIQILALYRQNRLEWLQWLLVIILSAILFQNIQLTWTSFNNFALEGQEIRALFQNIETYTQAKTSILIVANPRIHYEFSYSLKQYLNYVSRRENLVLSTYGLEGTDFKANIPEEAAWSFLDPKAVKQMYGERSLDAIYNKSNIGAIIVFSRLKDDFLATSKSWFQPDRYRQSEHNLYYFGGSILLYCKK